MRASVKTIEHFESATALVGGVTLHYWLGGAPDGHPVLLWHGANDVFSPASHARWLAERITGATVIVQADAAHFGALDVLPDILRWLSASRPAA